MTPVFDSMHSLLRNTLGSALALGSAIAAHAAVVAPVNTFTTAGASLTANASTGVLLTTASIDMGAGANAVAFYFTAESSNTSPAFTATFAGQAMNLVSANQAQQFSGIFYLINPSETSGDFVVSTGVGQTNAFAYSIVSLGNVGGLAGGGLATATSSAVSTTTTQSTQLSLSCTTALDGGFVLASLVNNATSSRPSPSRVSGNTDTALFGTLAGSTSGAGTNGYVNAGGGMGALHAYGDISIAGSYTDVYSNPYQRSAYVTLAFDAVPSPVPEPASLAALAAVGAMGFAALRRRRA